MSDPLIRLEEGPTKGRYVIEKDGAEAELTFSVTTPTLRIADHTFVPDAFRGTGAGLALVTRLVADAREKGFKASPSAPSSRHRRCGIPNGPMSGPKRSGA